MPRAAESGRKPPAVPRGSADAGLILVGSAVEGTRNFSRNQSHGSTAPAAGALNPSKPTEVYAAAVADLQDADSKSLTKLQQMRTQTPTPTPPSPARKRSSSAYAPGALPSLPPSPSTVSLLTRNSRVSDAPLSILERRGGDEPQLLLAVRGTEHASPGLSPSRGGRRTTSAPDSQSAQLAQQTGQLSPSAGADMWRPVIQEPPLRTVPSMGPRPDTVPATPAPSSRHTPESSPSAAAIAYVHPVHSPPAGPSPRAAPPLLGAQLGLVTVFSSPRSNDSTPTLTPSSLHAATMQRRITSPLSAAATPLPQAPARSGGGGADPGTQPSTPTASTPAITLSSGPGSGSLYPRPPDEAGVAGCRVGSPQVRTRRRSMMTAPAPADVRQGSPQTEGSGPGSGTGAECPQGSPRLQHSASTVSAAPTAADPSTHSASGRLQPNTSSGGGSGIHFGTSGGGGGSGGLLGYDSSRFEVGGGTGSPASRPNSGRGRAVQVLMDAVRSRDEGRFREAMEYLRLPNGTVAGLNERHTVTGRTPLHEAVMLNNLAVVRALLNAGADPHMGHMSQGPPVLHAAAWGESAMVALLLDAGADVNARDIAGYTGLHYACAGGHTEAARILLQRGADPQALTNEGDTPVQLGAGHPSLLHAVFGLSDGIRSQQPSNSTSNQGCDITLSPANSAQLVADVVAMGLELPGGAQAHAHGSPHTPGSARTARLLVPAPPGSGSGGFPGSRSLRIRALATDELQSSTPDGPPTTVATPASAATASSCAIPSPLSDLDDRAVPSPPPELRLPRGVRRQLSKGANLQDIIHAFEDEDQEIVSRFSHTGEDPLLPLPGVQGPLEAVQGTSSLLTAFQQRQQSGNISRPTSGVSTPPAGTPSGRPAPGSTHPRLPPPLQLQTKLSAALSSAAPSPAGFLARKDSATAGTNMATMLLQRAGSFSQAAGAGPGSPGSVASSPRSNLTGLAAVVPITPRFRFGIDIQKNPPMQQHGALQTQPSTGSQLRRSLSRSLSAPGAADAAAALAALGAEADGGVLPSSVSTPGTPPAAQPPAEELPLDREATFLVAAQGVPGSHAAVRPGSGLGMSDGERSSMGGGVSGDITPPLVADHSPPHSPLNASLRRRAGGANTVAERTLADGTPALTSPKMAASHSGIGGARGASVFAGGDESCSDGRAGPQGPQLPAAAPDPQWSRRSLPVAGETPHGLPPTGRATPTMLALEGSSDANRIAQAAQALKAQVSGPRQASHEALQLRAQAMFNRSVELQTGGIQWTRGELLGEGSYGRVYAGLNQQTGGLMAVKVLELLLRNNNMKEAVLAQLKELTQELDLYKKLHHKHVVAYIDHHYDAKASTLYIFLEYVPGGSIASMLERFGRFSEELVRNYTRQLLLGLDYLHSQRVVHRDVKGGNVLVTRDGVIKLADFGASRAFGNDTITDGMKSIKGSVFWMAPEVIKGTGYNYKADVWSLGCTVIEMMTGRHPWPTLDNPLTAMFHIARHCDGPPRPAFASDNAKDFLNLCLRHDPLDRPSAGELLQHPFVADPSAAGPLQT